jgi:hypothetical protein
MSTHAIPSPANDPQDSIRWQRAIEAQRLALVHIGREPVITDDGTTLSLVFTPDLSAPQTTTLRAIIRLSGLMRVTPAELVAIESDITGLVTFQGLASPTLAQAVAAVKAQSRILQALLRD